MPTFSVIVPTFNGAKYIAECLRSLFQQTLLPDEVIVVDDGSSDETVRIVQSQVASATVPLRVVELGVNSGGPARPINVGVDQARGEWISVLDQDDVFVPGRFEIVAAALAAHPQAAWVMTCCGRYGAPGRAGHRVQTTAIVRRLTGGRGLDSGPVCLSGLQVLGELLLYGCFPVGWPGFLFRRTDWQAKGSVDESLRVAADYDMLCWLCRRSPVLFIPSRLYLRRMHGANISAAGLTCSVDVVRLTHRHATQVDVEANPTFWPRFRQHYVRRLIMLGWTGHHREAYRRWWRATRAWGWNHDTHLTAAKLAVTWFWRRVLRRPFPYRTEDLENYVRELDAMRELCDRRSGCTTSPTVEERPATGFHNSSDLRKS